MTVLVLFWTLGAEGWKGVEKLTLVEWKRMCLLARQSERKWRNACETKAYTHTHTHTQTQKL